MDILFITTKLQKECTDAKQMLKRYGPLRSKLLQKRLTELRAASVLDDLRKLPQARCHALRENRKGELAVDLDQPYRLIFEIANDPKPIKADGGLDWLKTTAIRILGIEDYHE